MTSARQQLYIAAIWRAIAKAMAANPYMTPQQRQEFIAIGEQCEELLRIGALLYEQAPAEQEPEASGE